MNPIFLDQQGRLPFSHVTPIKLPEVSQILARNSISYESDMILSDKLLNIKDLEDIIRDWYRPLIDIDKFPYMYFMNNGITQALDYMSIHFRNIDIKMKPGDYFWLKTIKSASDSTIFTQSQVSYDTNPSAIDGSVHSDIWNSDSHILDGAYIGTCLDKINVPFNTEILLLGFSKNLGLPELRCGLILSKKKIQNLDVLQRTFGYFGLKPFNLIATVCKEINIIKLASELKKHQLEFCKYFEDFLPSQSALFATTKNEKYKFYKRPNGIIRIPLGESITKCFLHNQNTQ